MTVLSVEWLQVARSRWYNRCKTTKASVIRMLHWRSWIDIQLQHYRRLCWNRDRRQLNYKLQRIALPLVPPFFWVRWQCLKGGKVAATARQNRTLPVAADAVVVLMIVADSRCMCLATVPCRVGRSLSLLGNKLVKDNSLLKGCACWCVHSLHSVRRNACMKLDN